MFLGFENHKSRTHLPNTLILYNIIDHCLHLSLFKVLVILFVKKRIKTCIQNASTLLILQILLIVKLYYSCSLIVMNIIIGQSLLNRLQWAQRHVSVSWYNC